MALMPPYSGERVGHSDIFDRRDILPSVIGGRVICRGYTLKARLLSDLFNRAPKA